MGVISLSEFYSKKESKSVPLNTAVCCNEFWGIDFIKQYKVEWFDTMYFIYKITREYFYHK